MLARQLAQTALSAAFNPVHSLQGLAKDDLVGFISREMVIPETGKPLVLHPEQADVLNAMSHRTNGAFDYSTWLYSAPKKSGKTTIGAGVALWQACRVPDGQVYIIGNDQKQSDNRMMQAIRYAIDHNPRLRKHARIVRYMVYLDNGTKIESIPVDPRGEAGMNPTGLFWTEAWGAIGNRPELLWSEAALSPSRAGESFKFVESYAGYKGESLILERLYESIIKQGKPHDTIPELCTNGKSIGYWCTRHIMEWQVNNPDYYAQEERENVPAEYRRLHHNEWSDATTQFVPVEWWHSCKSEYTTNKNDTFIMGIDAATTSDCFAIVLVSRHDDTVQVHYTRKWQPMRGEKLLFSNPLDPLDTAYPEGEIRRLINGYNVIELAYDEYQLHDLMTRIRNTEFANCRSFPQGVDRLVADKRLYDLIRNRHIVHHGEADLLEHMSNAAAEINKQENTLRIVKGSDALKKIDLCIALSMASHRAFMYAV